MRWVGGAKGLQRGRDCGSDSPKCARGGVTRNCNRVIIAASNELTEVTPTHPKKFEPKSVVHFIYYIYKMIKISHF